MEEQEAKPKSRGKVTVGYGQSGQSDLEIVDFVQAEYLDHRLVSISQLEDESYCLVVENPISTSRNPQSVMRLSKESFIGLLSTSFLYFSCKGEDLGEMMKEVVESENIQYTFSDNLKAIGGGNSSEKAESTVE